MDNNAYNNAGQPILSKVVSSKKSFLFKSAIGITIILMDIIIIGVAAGNLNSTRYAFASSYYYYYSPFWTFIFIIPPAILSFVWQVAEFITLAVRKDRGIHPGAHVGLHLVLWLGYIVGATYAGLEVQSLDRYNREPYRSNRYYGSRYNYDNEEAEVQAALKRAFSFQMAILVFAVMLIIAHLTLFVRACIETHRRNKQVRGMYVPAKQSEQPWSVNQA
ncbi:hypothetical protein MCOR04_003452 [Pyricularia oryzae]|nr:hypothetical protein MCOR04_003452 [Pyricularia oryzae]